MLKDVTTQEHYCKILQFWCLLAVPFGTEHAGPHLRVSGLRATLPALVSDRFGIRVPLLDCCFWCIGLSVGISCTLLTLCCGETRNTLYGCAALPKQILVAVDTSSCCHYSGKSSGGKWRICHDCAKKAWEEGGFFGIFFTCCLPHLHNNNHFLKHISH